MAYLHKTTEDLMETEYLSFGLQDQSLSRNTTVLRLDERPLVKGRNPYQEAPSIINPYNG